MANLPILKRLHVDDVDASTLKALKLNPATNTPEDISYGDAAPTGISNWHVHFASESGSGNEVFLSQPGMGTDKMLGVKYLVYQFGNPYEGPTAASGTIQCTSNPTVSGDTIRIGNTRYTYRFRTSGDGLAQAFDVLIGADAKSTVRNLVRAIMGFPGGSGSDYHAATPIHPSVIAKNVIEGTTAAIDYLDTATVTSRLSGTLGNSTQIIFDGTTGDGAFTLSGATLSGGGGQHLVQGSAYYALPGLWQLSASHGYADASVVRRLSHWTFTSPAVPTVQNGGGATANVQLELMYGASTSLYTLTASGSTDSLGRTQYSSNGGGVDLPSGQFIWARVPSTAGASWECPPGAVWTLYFARTRG